MSNRCQDHEIVAQGFLPKVTPSPIWSGVGWFVTALVMIFPITIDGSLNQGSSDRFSNREIRVALTELIPVCLSTRMVYLFLSCTRCLHSLGIALLNSGSFHRYHCHQQVWTHLEVYHETPKDWRVLERENNQFVIKMLLQFCKDSFVASFATMQ